MKEMQMFKDENICLKGRTYRNGLQVHKDEVEYILHVHCG